MVVVLIIERVWPGNSLSFFDHMHYEALLMSYGILSIIVTVSSMIVNSSDWDETLCYDNAIAQSLEYSNNICTTQGGLIVYTFTAFALIFLLFAWSVFYQLWNNDCEHSLLSSCLQLATVYLIPLIPVLITYYGDNLGYGRVAIFCFALPYPYTEKSYVSYNQK